MPPMPSPPTSPDPTDGVSNVPAFPYSEQFSDQLMKAVLNPASPTGTVVLDKGAKASANGDAIRLEDAMLPEIDPLELPLALDDPRRIYRSAVPGVRLTHPGGLIEGGSPSHASGRTSESSDTSSVESRELAQRLVENYSAKSPTQLRRAIASETQRQLDELKQQMQERNDAIAENERISKEIRQSEAERATERKIEEKLRKQAAERRDSI